MAKKINFFITLCNKISKISRKNAIRLVSFIVLSLLLLIFPYPTKYFNSAPVVKGISITKEIVLPDPPPYPVNQFHSSNPAITASGVLIKDLSSGAILYTKNQNVRFPPASTTKIMTALVALDSYKPEDILTVKNVINDGRKMDLIQSERIT